MKEWKITTTIKKLCGFLEVIGYYRRFVHNNRKIAVPLTTILKKDVFNKEDIKVFEQLKVAMCTTLVLATPNFTKMFLVECNPSRKGIGAGRLPCCL